MMMLFVWRSKRVVLYPTLLSTSQGIIKNVKHMSPRTRFSGKMHHIDGLCHGIRSKRHRGLSAFARRYGYGLEISWFPWVAEAIFYEAEYEILGNPRCTPNVRHKWNSSLIYVYTSRLCNPYTVYCPCDMARMLCMKNLSAASMVHSCCVPE